MKEQLRQNRHPLNQQAKALLIKVKADPDPGALYASQLMKWSLDQGKDGLKYQFRDRIQSSVEALQGQDPAQATRWLMDGPGPKEQRLRPNALKGQNPQAAARTLLESVHSKLVAMIPGYQPT